MSGVSSASLGSIPGSVILGVLILEVGEHVLGAVGGSDGQGPVVLAVEPHASPLHPGLGGLTGVARRHEMAAWTDGSITKTGISRSVFVW